MIKCQVPVMWDKTQTYKYFGPTKWFCFNIKKNLPLLCRPGKPWSKECLCGVRLSRDCNDVSSSETLSSVLSLLILSMLSIDKAGSSEVIGDSSVKITLIPTFPFLPLSRNKQRNAKSTGGMHKMNSIKKSTLWKSKCEN